MRTILLHLMKYLGGRPMKFVSFMFMDVASGKAINLYRDSEERFWLAKNRWGWLRVPVRAIDVVSLLEKEQKHG